MSPPFVVVCTSALVFPLTCPGWLQGIVIHASLPCYRASHSGSSPLFPLKSSRFKMQQTKEEFALGVQCLGQAARLLDAAGDDLLVIKGEERRACGRREGSVRVRRSKTSLPVASSLSGGSIRPGDASCAGAGI